jgi:hypothetical protein
VGLTNFKGKGPLPLLCAGLGTAHEKILVNDVPNLLHYYMICIAYTQFTDVAAHHIIRPGGPRVEVPCFTQKTMSKLKEGKIRKKKNERNGE